MRTQVAIVGGGPAGLMLGRLLELRGHRVGDPRGARPRVRAAARARGRARAGDDGPDGRGRARRADARARASSTTASSCASAARATGSRLSDLTGGRAITIYGQQEVVKDLIDARLESGLPLYFEVSDVSVDPETPTVRVHARGRAAHAGVRPDRRLRRLPRRLPAGDRRRADRLRARVPVRLDGDPGRVRAELATSSSTRTTSAGSRSPRCARRRSRACTSSASRTRSRGPTTRSGRSSTAASGWRSTAGRSSRRASRRCARSSSSRCSTSTCTWPATRRTSSRRPAPRA